MYGTDLLPLPTYKPLILAVCMATVIFRTGRILYPSSCCRFTNDTFLYFIIDKVGQKIGYSDLLVAQIHLIKKESKDKKVSRLSLVLMTGSKLGGEMLPTVDEIGLERGGGR